MRYILLLITLLWLPVQTLLAEESTTVAIEISGLQEASGDVYLAVYDSPDSWLKEEGVIQGQKVSIEESRQDGIVVTALQLPPGEYAFSVFYDRNGNGALDTNFIGIPKEPVAISNNARPRFGPPKYKHAVFTVGAEAIVQEIEIDAI